MGIVIERGMGLVGSSLISIDCGDGDGAADAGFFERLKRRLVAEIVGVVQR